MRQQPRRPRGKKRRLRRPRRTRSVLADLEFDLQTRFEATMSSSTTTSGTTKKDHAWKWAKPIPGELKYFLFLIFGVIYA
ncbi:hypothetical protein RchiOBHm_Chr6g0288501 [Rosa chinensis]|uniref:Uncharacterized protein n=1 Tax=Rosa chinensis TaxID=74649 RepID=A0A2P6PVG4_ROSCH|nr:hypothetical protein RchiOBHm_Chr6g0288501 [Rosa chinensis]